MFLKFRQIILFLIITLSQAYALNCPDPNQSSLRYGIVPEPWVVNPFSDHQPQGERDARFVRANILVAASIGRGVVCTYQNSVGFYSIWWQTNVKIPAPIDYVWRNTLGGYECTTNVNACIFYA